MLKWWSYLEEGMPSKGRPPLIFYCFVIDATIRARREGNEFCPSFRILVRSECGGKGEKAKEQEQERKNIW